MESLLFFMEFKELMLLLRFYKGNKKRVKNLDERSLGSSLL